MGEATIVLRVDSEGAVTREPALERLGKAPMIGDVILDERTGPTNIASPSSLNEFGHVEVQRRDYCHLLLLTQPLGQAALFSLLNDYLTPSQALAVCQTCRYLLGFRGAVTVAEVKGRRRFTKLLALLSRGALPRLTTLTCLPLSIPGQQQQQVLGPLEARCLASHLSTEASEGVPRGVRPTLPHLRHLALVQQELGEGAGAVFDALRMSHPWLLSLRLDGTAVGSSCGRLAHCLSGLDCLTSLSLNGCGLTRDDMATLAPALPAQCLRELHLSNNPFLADVRGLHALVGGGGFDPSAALRGVHKLSLGGSLLHAYPSSACLKVLASALEHHQTPDALAQALPQPPTKLGQSRRRLQGHTSTPSLRAAAGLSTSPLLPCLQELDLWHAELDDDGAASLAQGLHAGLLLGSLLSLSVNAHPTHGTEAWVLLCHAIQAFASGTGPTGPPLQHLRLGHDAPSDQGCKALATMLRSSLPRLTTLDLSGCELGDANMGLIARVGALSSHRCLRTLLLGGVGLGQHALQALLPSPPPTPKTPQPTTPTPAAASTVHPAAGLLALAAGRPSGRAPAPSPRPKPVVHTWPSLTHLDLSDNDLGPHPDAPTLAKALRHGGLPVLRVCDVSLNRLGRRGVQVLIQAVRGPPPAPCLARLSLYVNGLGHGQLEELGIEARAPGAPDRIKKALRL